MHSKSKIFDFLLTNIRNIMVVVVFIIILQMFVLFKL